MNLFRVAPFDQNLSINGRDLLDNEATLESLRIYPHSVILLKVSHFITFDYSEPSDILENMQYFRRTRILGSTQFFRRTYILENVQYFRPARVLESIRYFTPAHVLDIRLSSAESSAVIVKKLYLRVFIPLIHVMLKCGQ
jgi:hypothetical protein